MEHKMLIYSNQEFCRLLFSKKRLDFAIENMTVVYINENLIQRRKQLFWLTKNKVKELGYQYWWTYNGEIYVRENKDSDRIHIKTECDLEQLYSVVNLMV